MTTQNPPSILILTGPSCSGKSTLEKRLIGLGFLPVVSHTTRAPRAGEVDGESYHFVSGEEFARMEVAAEFIETVTFAGQQYGASKAVFEKCFRETGRVVVVAEPRGAAMIQRYARSNGIHCVSAFIDAHPAVLAKRFLARFAEDCEVMGKHMVLERYAQRLGGMMAVEMGWRKHINEPANDRHPKYDVHITSFDEGTEAGVLQDLIRYVEAPERRVGEMPLAQI